ncbi:hypothetical protein [uncultured Flavobacterium sp.]|mgnify:CR=1 FL=1|uniref:hypothetical protein n=1 Tax=uncultured Flavobacterium sp. TaxID=165435 RepID=UPI0030ED225D|tara:strand:+ start:24387 stop:24920 length:534 start_codon:yes stop_codon:yes gene_type:complete
MKNVIVTLSLILCTSYGFAQNKNVQTEEKTTVRTIKDSDGEKKIVKKEETKEVQNIEFEKDAKNTLNKETKQTPVEVTSTTEVSVDGVTRSIDVDRSAYYELNGRKFEVAVDKAGYNLNNTNGENLGVLRKTSNNNYIYIEKKKVSVGYFDNEGNLILETYDPKNDVLIINKYIMVK